MRHSPGRISSKLGLLEYGGGLSLHKEAESKFYLLTSEHVPASIKSLWRVLGKKSCDWIFILRIQTDSNVENGWK